MHLLLDPGYDPLLQEVKHYDKILSKNKLLEQLVQFCAYGPLQVKQF